MPRVQADTKKKNKRLCFCFAITRSWAQIAVLFCMLQQVMTLSARAELPTDTGRQTLRVPQFVPYTMEHNYFYCTVPEHWHMERNADKDKEQGIHEIQLTAPIHSTVPITVYISYYLPGNAEVNDYRAFIRRNSRNITGRKTTPHADYQPVKKISLNGMKGFALTRLTKRYLPRYSKSGEHIALKEKQYVLPARKGFYVLHYKAPLDMFYVFLHDFEQIATSFRSKAPEHGSPIKVVAP